MSKLKNTGSYRARQKRINECRNLSIKGLTVEEIVRCIDELAGLYNMVSRKGFGKYERTNSGSTTGPTSKDPLGPQVNVVNFKTSSKRVTSSVYYKSVNQTIYGTSIMCYEDFESLLNFSITQAVIRLKKDLIAREIIHKIEDLHVRNNEEFDRDFAYKNPKNLKVKFGDTEGNLLCLNKKRDEKWALKLADKLKSLNIKSVKSYKIINELYGYACSTFKSKTINGSMSLEFRRVVNRTRHQRAVEDLVQEDMEAREDFLREFVENKVEKTEILEVDVKHLVFQTIQNSVKAGLSSREIFFKVKEVADRSGVDTESFNLDEAMSLIEKFVKSNVEEKKKSNDSYSESFAA